MIKYKTFFSEFIWLVGLSQREKPERLRMSRYYADDLDVQRAFISIALLK